MATRSLPAPGSGIVPASSGLVEVVSGSFGAGHDAAAGEIALRLDRAGHGTRVWDVVDLMPGVLGRGLRAGYLRQVQNLPATWAWMLRELQDHEWLSGLVRRGLATASEPLLRLAEAAPRCIVSTHPFASQVLGELRWSGRLDVPVVTYLTDMSVHRLWVHPGVDLHLALHELPAAAARELGAHRVHVVSPAVGGAFTSAVPRPPMRSYRREVAGLPPRGKPLVLATGGAQGIGELLRTATDVYDTGLATPVVLCGRNERLRRRVDAAGTAIALGWVSDMPRLLGAVDAVVQNAGGITSLEALAAGVPVLTYRCLRGHGETNAAALEEAMLVPWARGRNELAGRLAEAIAVPPAHRVAPAAWAARPDVADMIAGEVGVRAA